MDEDVQIRYGLEASTDPADILAQLKEGIQSDKVEEKEIKYTDNSDEAIANARKITSELNRLKNPTALTFVMPEYENILA